MSYQNIDKIFTRNLAVSSAAEAHGMAVGMLSINAEAPFSAWLMQLFEDDTGPKSEHQPILKAMFETAKSALVNADYEFEPFLPDDEAPLAEQVEALAAWCQGFLFGVGSLYGEQAASAEAGEVLRDIAEFARLDTNAEGEEDEIAFTEVVEYLRTAVFLLFAEFNSYSKRRRLH